MYFFLTKFNNILINEHDYILISFLLFNSFHVFPFQGYFTVPSCSGGTSRRSTRWTRPPSRRGSPTGTSSTRPPTSADSALKRSPTTTANSRYVKYVSCLASQTASEVEYDVRLHFKNLDFCKRPKSWTFLKLLSTSQQSNNCHSKDQNTPYNVCRRFNM